MTEITARLENWRYDPHWKVMLGDIFDDTKGRFEDGRWVHTSTLKHTVAQIENLKEGDIITTKSSNYLLGKKGEVYQKVTGD